MIIFPTSYWLIRTYYFHSFKFLKRSQELKILAVYMFKTLTWAVELQTYILYGNSILVESIEILWLR